MPLPDISIDTTEDLLLSDPPDPILQPSLTSDPPTNQKKEETYTYSEAISAAASGNMDIRPRVFDGISKKHLLVDTGSMCSVSKPTSTDVLRSDLLLESVDGSSLKCYGTKPMDIRLNR